MLSRMAVGVVERVGYFTRDPNGLVHAELRLAVQLLRMLQRRRGLDLHDEPLGAEHGGEFGLGHLDRDLAVREGGREAVRGRGHQGAGYDFRGVRSNPIRPRAPADAWQILMSIHPY